MKLLFVQIARNRRNTWIALAVYICILIAVTLVIGMSSPQLGKWIAIGSIIYFVWGFIRMGWLSYRGLAGYELTTENAPEIIELVEGLCLAAGIPQPKVLFDPDPLPNAYALGWDPKHASITLTKGLLEIMDKQELEGVIAHELEHIRNYDTRLTITTNLILNLIVGISLGGLLIGAGMVVNKSRGLIALVFRVLGLGLVILFGLITLVAIPLGKIFYFMISRQREYLADAGSAELTRNPDGLISALSKLKDPALAMPPSHNMVLNAAYINGPKMNSLLELFSDHPTLDKRILKLQEAFGVNNGKQ